MLRVCPRALQRNPSKGMCAPPLAWVVKSLSLHPPRLFRFRSASFRPFPVRFSGDSRGAAALVSFSLLIDLDFGSIVIACCCLVLALFA
jgi:hypothetical protein